MTVGKKLAPNLALKVNSMIFKESAKVVLLGLPIDNYLTFEHITANSK